jgi:hypothetical protein
LHFFSKFPSLCYYIFLLWFYLSLFVSNVPYFFLFLFLLLSSLFILFP